MRLKYRGWNGEKMIPVSSINQEYEEIRLPDGLKYYPTDLTVELANGECLKFTPDADRKRLMQCIGLKDSKGVDIYEGDIIRTDNNIAAAFGEVIHEGEVVFQRSAYLLKSGVIAQSIATLSNYKWKMEVIGNIYENPELLK